LEWAFALTVLLIIYKAAFSGTTFYRFNRFYLLGATVLSALLPLVHFTFPESTPLVSNISIHETEFAQELSGTFTFLEEPDDSVMADTPAPARKTSLWAVILVCMYSAYVIMLLTGWTRSIIRARRFLRGKNRRRVSRTVWLVTHDEDFGPFSWMNYIVISDTERGFARRASLRHEYSHVKLLHSVDLVFLLACTILNPVCWLVLQEIKIVHEYEADNEVINRYGIRNSDYQKLLIMRTVGAEAYALASSFNLNIKKRIIMLNKNQTKKRRLIWLLILIPLLGTTSVLFARSELSIGTDSYDYNEFRIIIQGDIVGGQKIKWHSDNGIDECLAANEPSRLQLNEVGDYLDNSDIVKERVQQVTLVIWPNSSTEIVDEVKKILTSKGMFNLNYEDPPLPEENVIRTVIHPDSREQDLIDVTKDPEFPGGPEALMEYMRKNIQYPADAREQKIEGRVLVQFIINGNGSIQEPEIIKSVHPSLDAEAVRLVSSMPNWKPAMSRGLTFRQKYTLPVDFRLASNHVETTYVQPTWISIDKMNLTMSEQYVVMYEKGEYPDSSTAESLESDIKDLFNGKRKFILVPKSDENLKKVKEIIAKYPDKKVNWML